MTPDRTLERAAAAMGVGAYDLRFLGQGSWGSAWETPRKTVIKVTQDPTELRLVKLGKSHAARGLPEIVNPPVEVEPGVFAYEREALPNLPPGRGALEELTVVARPPVPMPFEDRLRRYDEVLYDGRRFASFPLIFEALWKLRRHGVVVWDLKPSNLGMRGDDAVIRDGRCIVLSNPVGRIP